MRVIRTMDEITEEQERAIQELIDLRQEMELEDGQDPQ